MLQLCESCRRHVRALPCPFCGHAAGVATTPFPAQSHALSRAQLLAAAALTSAAVACTGAKEPAPVPVYGAPVDPAAVDDAGAPDQAQRPSVPQPTIYGGPPAPDDVGPTQPPAPQPAAPMYGAPPTRQ